MGPYTDEDRKNAKVLKKLCREEPLESGDMVTHTMALRLVIMHGPRGDRSRELFAAAIVDAENRKARQDG